MNIAPSMRRLAAAGLVVTGTLCATGAAATAAAPLSFSGTLMTSNPLPTNSPPCGDQLTVVNKNDPPTFLSAGFSNLGSFVNNLVHCLMPPSAGQFEFDFGGGNTLVGTYTSAVSPTAEPLVFQFVGSYGVTGGTGSFQGWGGEFSSFGYLDRRELGVGSAGAVFHGQLLPVPEPATWGLMLAGLGVMVGARRRLRVR